jgi:hypothetical protein
MSDLSRVMRGSRMRCSRDMCLRGLRNLLEQSCVATGVTEASELKEL